MLLYMNNYRLIELVYVRLGLLTHSGVKQANPESVYYHGDEAEG